MEKEEGSVAEPKAWNGYLTLMELHEPGSCFQEAGDYNEMSSLSQGTEPALKRGTFSVPGLSGCDNLYLPRFLSASDYVPPILTLFNGNLYCDVLSLQFHCMLSMHITCCFGLVRVASKGSISGPEVDHEILDSESRDVNE